MCIQCNGLGVICIYSLVWIWFQFMSQVVRNFRLRLMFKRCNVFTTDGSCLPHSLSRAMVGYEVFYDALRASLVKELTENSEWYKENLPERKDAETRLEDEEWERVWQSVVDAARPTHGATVGSEKHLHGIHILALANLLKRPILLLDSPSKMRQIEAVNIDGCGMYLPLRHSRNDIIKAHNRPLGPIMIAWQGEARNHYVALAQRQRDIESQLQSMDESDESTLRDVLDWLDIIHRASDLPPAITKALFTLIENNTASARDVASRTICKVLDNIATYCSVPSDAHAVYCKLSLEQTTVKHNLVGVSGALDLLLSVGFDEKEVEGIPCIVFPRDVDQAKLRRAHHGQLCELLSCFSDRPSACAAVSTPPLPASLLKGKAWVGLREVETVEDMRLLFGPTPLMMDSWEEAVAIYGSGEIKSGRVWALNPSRDAIDVVVDMLERAKRSFSVLSRGEFGPNGWSHELRMSLENIYSAALIQCPICRRSMRWPVQPGMGVEQLEYEMNMELRGGVFDPNLKLCEGCLHNDRATFLSVKDTRYLRILHLLRQSLSDSARCWKCPDTKCGAANLDIDNRCTLCRAMRPENTVHSPEKRKYPHDASSDTVTGCSPSKRTNISSPTTFTPPPQNRGYDVETKASKHDTEASASAKDTVWTCRSCTCPNPVVKEVCGSCLARRGDIPLWEALSTPSRSESIPGGSLNLTLDFSALISSLADCKPRATHETTTVADEQESTPALDTPAHTGPDIAVDDIAVADSVDGVEMPTPGLHRAHSECVRGEGRQYAVVFHTSLLKHSSHAETESGEATQLEGSSLSMDQCSLPPALEEVTRVMSQPITTSEYNFVTRNLSRDTRDLGSLWNEMRPALLKEKEGTEYELQIDLV